jgi:hypothetical protein
MMNGNLLHRSARCWLAALTIPCAATLLTHAYTIPWYTLGPGAPSLQRWGHDDLKAKKQISIPKKGAEGSRGRGGGQGVKVCRINVFAAETRDEGMYNLSTTFHTPLLLTYSTFPSLRRSRPGAPSLQRWGHDDSKAKTHHASPDTSRQTSPTDNCQLKNANPLPTQTPSSKVHSPDSPGDSAANSAANSPATSPFTIPRSKANSNSYTIRIR